VSACAPARATLPPFPSMAERDAEDKVWEGGEEEVEGGDTMNHRTEVPSMAAATAVISPRPPGGEISTSVLVEVCSGVSSLVFDWSALYDNFRCCCCCVGCCWSCCCILLVLVVNEDDCGAKAFADGKFMVTTLAAMIRSSVFAFILAGQLLAVAGILLVSRG